MSSREFKRLVFATAVALALSPTLAVAASLGPISEETPPATCDPGSFLSAVSCSGSHCDNIKIFCQSRPGVATGHAQWTPWFSEENGRGKCPAKHFVAGLACQKDYCDNISLYCVEIPSAVAGTDACFDTRLAGDATGSSVSVRDFPGRKQGVNNFLASEMVCKGGWCGQVGMCVRQQ